MRYVNCELSPLSCVCQLIRQLSCARWNPMQICVCAWIYHWTEKLWKIRTGPAGLQAAGPWWAVGRGPRAAGPPGRGAPAGRWAAGLLLAKPKFSLEKGKPWRKIQRTVLFNKRKILTETGTSVCGCRYHLLTAPVLHIIPEPSMFNYSMFRPRLHGSGQIFTRTNLVPGRPFYMDPCKLVVFTLIRAKFRPVATFDSSP